MKELTEIEIQNLFTSFDLFLMKNPEKVELLLKNSKEFIKEANEFHTKYITEIIIDENKLNAINDYLAKLVYNKINK